MAPTVTACVCVCCGSDCLFLILIYNKKLFSFAPLLQLLSSALSNIRDSFAASGLFDLALIRRSKVGFGKREMCVQYIFTPGLSLVGVYRRSYGNNAITWKRNLLLMKRRRARDVKPNLTELTELGDGRNRALALCKIKSYSGQHRRSR